MFTNEDNICDVNGAQELQIVLILRYVTFESKMLSFMHNTDFKIDILWVGLVSVGLTGDLTIKAG